MASELRIRRILVTGGCGFIGANFVRHLLESEPALEITNLDAMTYAGNPDNLAEIAALGHPPYPHRFDRTHTISEIVERYHGHAGKKEEAEAARIND